MNQTTITKQRGLSDFALKYFAMVCMILYHIHYFFSFTGKIPLFFSWIGRLAAPLFLFCIVEGFLHTHDRKKYFLRIYAIAIFMGLVQFSFYNIASGLVRPDGFFPQNQMLASFSVLLVVLWGIDRCQKKQWIRGLSAILIPVFLPFLLYGLFAVSEAFGIPYGNFLLNLLVYSVLPCHTAIIDGGTATLLGGVILYLTHRHRRLQAGAFALFVLAWDILPVLLFMPAGTSASFFFTDAYEWLEVFAVIPMLCYNGTRGHGSKKLFYWFYPTHIYVLYALSFLLYLTLYGMGS